MKMTTSLLDVPMTTGPRADETSMGVSLCFLDGKHATKAQSDHLLFLLSGALDAQIGTSFERVTAGGWLHIPNGVDLELSAVSAECRFVKFSTPYREIGDEHIRRRHGFERSSAISTFYHPDPERIQPSMLVYDSKGQPLPGVLSVPGISAELGAINSGGDVFSVSAGFDFPLQSAQKGLHAIFCFSGMGRILIGDNIVPLVPSSCVFVPSHLPHVVQGGAFRDLQIALVSMPHRVGYSG